MMRLCFGTFAKVLKLCKLPSVTDVQLVGTLTRTIDSTCEYGDSDGTAVSRLLSCTQNLSNGQIRRTEQRSRTDHNDFESGWGTNRLSNVVLAGQKANRNEVLQKIAANVLPLIDEDRKALAALAIIDIIKQDTVIDSDKRLSFEKNLDTTKKALLSQDKYILSELFTGVLLYSVVSVLNTVGKDCIAGIDKAYVDGFAQNGFLYDFATDFPNVAAEQQENLSTSRQAIDADLIRVYLSKVGSKYNEIKTLLYSDQPKPFYSFYVCNDIQRRIPVQSRFGSSYRTVTIHDATAHALADFSRFVILSGTGGLGKSMMLRHLLLDAIERYDESEIVPLFIPLKDFDDSAGTLFDYVFSKLDGYGVGITKPQFESLLADGKCLVLFDGLDEIGTKHGGRFEKELEEFTDRYPSNRYVISSRPYRSFVSYSRFTVLFLQPFSKAQALQLIDKLEFRPDDPIIKAKFRTELEQTLYWSHREFTENPLLLTIMLMTFEQFAEVPSKMHIFYREAFVALSQKHDASKGAYKRTLRTGLSADKFADYFAEFCSRSYHDEKFELSEAEFAEYYYKLKERDKAEDDSTSAEDFLYDLCSNMCLMFFESGKYHFTHRSFQEYFCAFYFSKQKDKNLSAIGNFFEKRRSRNFGDKTFVMLYDMIPDKVDEYVFLPFLSNMFKECDETDGYWTFLEIMYPSLSYETGETEAFISNSPASYLYEFVKKSFFDNNCDCNGLPFYESLATEKYGYIEDEDGKSKLVNLNDVDYDYELEYGTPETVGWVLEFDVEEVRKKKGTYKDLLTMLESEDFVLRHEYSDARDYFNALVSKQKPTGDGLFDLFN
jgi:hypothetical protein